jgi:hypothetical protein
VHLCRTRPLKILGVVRLLPCCIQSALHRGLQLLMVEPRGEGCACSLVCFKIMAGLRCQRPDERRSLRTCADKRSTHSGRSWPSTCAAGIICGLGLRS